jgi:hypothetical protein
LRLADNIAEGIWCRNTRSRLKHRRRPTLRLASSR